MKSVKEIKEQTVFIKCLVQMLQNSIENNINKSEWDYCFNNYTQIQDDIKRLRRELMELSKMIDWRNYNNTKCKN